MQLPYSFCSEYRNGKTCRMTLFGIKNNIYFRHKKNCPYFHFVSNFLRLSARQFSALLCYSANRTLRGGIETPHTLFLSIPCSVM